MFVPIAEISFAQDKYKYINILSNKSTLLSSVANFLLIFFGVGVCWLKVKGVDGLEVTGVDGFVIVVVYGFDIMGVGGSEVVGVDVFDVVG